MATSRDLPGGPRLPTALQGLWYGLAPYGFFEAARRRHGDVFTVRIPGATWTVLADPSAIREVFTGDPDVLWSGEANEALSPLIGRRNLLLLDGADHLRRRRVLLPPFHGARMREYRETMAQAADRELDAWPPGRPEAMLVHAQAITLDVIMRAVFGLAEGPQLERLAGLLRRILDYTQSWAAMLRFALHGPEAFAAHPPFARMVDPLDEALLGEIAHRRRAEDLARRGDILSLLLLARDEDGAPLPDRDVRDELLTLLVAGHETTAATLAWAVHQLARDRPAQDRLAAGEPGFADAVVAETLRLRPPVPLVVRRLKAPLTIGGRALPAGATVAPCAILVHRDPALHEDPAAFRPDRYLGQAPAGAGWLPFGGGVRRCIGAAFAQLEACVVLERLTQRFVVRPDRGRPERVGRRGIVLVPNRGGRVVLEPRAPAARRGAGAAQAQRVRTLQRPPAAIEKSR
jgi:cytochrome P450 family 135